MKKFSYWAKSHKQTARFIIVVSIILLIAAGYLTGSLINELGITIPTIYFNADFVIVFYGAALLSIS